MPTNLIKGLRMKRLRFPLGYTVALILSLFFSNLVYAQEKHWTPSRPVHLIAPGAPGAILDIVARQLADKIAGPLGQPVIVENKPSAGGILAMQALARSPADGHTIAIASFAELAVNRSLYKDPGYDSLRDFAPVTLLFEGTQLLIADPALGVESLAALVHLAKEQPGSVFYGSPGVARPPHLYMERFKAEAGIDLKHAPYKGTPPLLQALLSGEIQLALEGVPPLLPQVRAGKLTPLAVTGDKRLAVLPGVPTFAELGVSGMTAAWVGIVAPAGTPIEAVQRLNREFAKALDSPELNAAYEAGGRQIVTGTAQAMADMLRKSIPEWERVVREAGMKPD